ncbi:hypothetical protein F2P81_020476 [Scophthalmus maximus]|uniref:Uncharacterized protein n=1 Tax=Scophthalmus maximus TaxID=52904 RepID=A0A6A4S635_SCOMX|nr:hypothetical protein F2P81_020476 [Scophthalmus maximus]
MTRKHSDRKKEGKLSNAFVLYAFETYDYNRMLTKQVNVQHILMTNSFLKLTLAKPTEFSDSGGGDRSARELKAPLRESPPPVAASYLKSVRKRRKPIAAERVRPFKTATNGSGGFS